MHRVNWNETGDYVIAAVTGGALAGVVFKAFVLGAAGVLCAGEIKRIQAGAVV